LLSGVAPADDQLHAPLSRVLLGDPRHGLAKLREGGDELLPTAIVERDRALRLTSHCESES